MRKIQVYFDGRLMFEVVMYQNETVQQAIDRVKQKIQVSYSVNE
jgi:hypothetical protein